MLKNWQLRLLIAYLFSSALNLPIVQVRDHKVGTDVWINQDTSAECGDWLDLKGKRVSQGNRREGQ